MTAKPILLPVVDSPLSSRKRSSLSNPAAPKDRYIGSTKVVILCAVSAVFAAIGTSLLFILLLSNRPENIFGNITQIRCTIDPEAFDSPAARNSFSLVNFLDKASAERHVSALALSDVKMGGKSSRDEEGSVKNELIKGSSKRILDVNHPHGPLDSVSPSKELDFAIIGWPKTGTTFLLKMLGQHPEINMPEKEFCGIISNRGEERLQDWLENEAPPQSSQLISAPQKYGIKCPVMIRDTRGIENLRKLSDSTRLVIGVRNPVLWFESFYNYRVMENYDLNLPQSNIKSPFDLIGTNHWMGLCTHYAKYDLFLKQLAKVSLTMRDAFEMDKGYAFSKDTWGGYWIKRVTVNPYKVFIYTTEQLSDKNLTRLDQFSSDLQEFLRLDTPIGNLDSAPKINANNRVYPEYINICDPKYNPIKQILLEAGRKSSEWIINKFIKSKDVVVSDENFLIENLKSWRVDPCKKRSQESEIAKKAVKERYAQKEKVAFV